MQHVVGRHGAQRADLLDGYLPSPAAAFALAFAAAAAAPFVLDEHVRDGLGPVGAVAEEAEVRERFLRGAELGFALGELVAEGDEELAEALALVLR